MKTEAVKSSYSISPFPPAYLICWTDGFVTLHCLDTGAAVDRKLYSTVFWNSISYPIRITTGKMVGSLSIKKSSASLVLTGRTAFANSQ